MKKISRYIGYLSIGLALPMAAQATDGYFSHGYGLKAKGMGGAATAMANDSMGGANNPASMVWVGDRMDLGIDWFKPKRDAERTGAGIPSLNGKVESGHDNFLIPEIGYSAMANKDTALGITIYGNGGMNTSYPQGNYNCGGGGANILCGGGGIGVDLTQLIIAPTMSYKFNPNHSVGAAILFGYQRFKAEGLQAFNNAPGFPPFTGAPGSVTNVGYDYSNGVGVRIGYLGKLSNAFSIGAAYAPQMAMSKFDKYKGLFAENGGFDIPENYTIGIAVNPSSAITLAADFQRINYSGVASVGNPSSNRAPLGAANGPGFGWQDVKVVKLGVDYKMNPQLNLRAGYNHSTNPIRSQDVTFNILAPGVVQNHYTLGMTYAASKSNEITASFMYAPRNTVSGPSLFNGLFPQPPNAGGIETIGMSQSSLGVAWGKKF